jgi:hypothetical protein
MGSVPGVWEWIVGLDSGELFTLMMMSGMTLIFTVILVTGLIYKIHKSRLDDALKRELLERGLSAEEIATVIRATPAGRGGCGSHID